MLVGWVLNKRWCFLYGMMRKDLSATMLPTTEQKIVLLADVENLQACNWHHNVRTIYSVLYILRWQCLWNKWWQLPPPPPPQKKNSSTSEVIERELGAMNILAAVETMAMNETIKKNCIE